MENLEKIAHEWIMAAPNEANIVSEFYCETRDIFEARNNKTPDILIEKGVDESLAYLIFSILGEIGNNSFDHNIANWPDAPGIFFGLKYEGGKGIAVIADRGLGILTTLKKAVPDLKNDAEALQIAFTKKISGRVLENRGNGLKFVKKNVFEKNLNLEFGSGKAMVFLNHDMRIEETRDNIKGCLAILKF